MPLYNVEVKSTSYKENIITIMNLCFRADSDPESAAIAKIKEENELHGSEDGLVLYEQREFVHIVGKYW